VCGDPALERRFQKIVVRELSPEQTLEVLEARRSRLERHHNVAIADEALTASVTLTDRFITDRARPDRAIDALDEACAHAQASATYSPALESMIVERRELLRQREASGAAMDAPDVPVLPPIVEEDPFERLARDGLKALERFGAELEAAFTGQPVPGPGATSRPASASPPPPPARAPETASARLAALEAELHRRLIDEGLVVRGHDVARVVSVATGLTVEWRA
jgi:ATP-dependent Clp protease ATP-binding subunit ClpA